MTVEAVVEPEQPSSDQLSALEPSPKNNMEEDNSSTSVEVEIASNVDHRHRVNEESVSEDKVSSSQSCAITKETEGHHAEEAATKQLETQVSHI